MKFEKKQLNQEKGGSGRVQVMISRPLYDALIAISIKEVCTIKEATCKLLEAGLIVYRQEEQQRIDRKEQL